jgi:hypothetical protein
MFCVSVVLLDIDKAFGTIDRSFLVTIIRRCGDSLGMCTWVLLGHTVAAAVDGAWLAAPQCCSAGVRQGFPLSPLLYFSVAEASARWW